MTPHPVPPTHQEVKHQLWAKYDFDIASGKFIPFSYPFGAYGSFIVLIYFLARNDQVSSNAIVRWLVWTANFILAMYCILYTRSRFASAAYGLGLANAWSILWFTAILLANDSKTYFSRIERIGGATLTIPKPASLEFPEELGDDHEIPLLEGPLCGNSKREKVVIMSSATVSELKSLKYYTQYRPVDSFIERLDWSLDLMSNFRGMAWNWRSPSMPIVPKKVVRDVMLGDRRIPVRRLGHPLPGLGGNQHFNGGRRSGSISRFKRQHPTKAECLRRARLQFILGYMMLDVVKTLCIHDPYFSGFPDWPAPTYFPQTSTSSAVLVKSYRLILALFCIYLALQTVFSLAPIVFVGFLGADLIGVRGEPWMYPDEWGSYSATFTRGLAGWWGVWWHQTFRFAFEATSSWILQQFPSLNSNAGPGMKIAQLFIVFCLSGFLHACGSYTSMGESRPISGSFLFFFLQPFGIFLQMALVKMLRLSRSCDRSWLKLRLLVAFNFTYTHVWFYYTAPLLVDDLVKSGIYLYEPVPVSFLRALGFGAKGDSWWCWDGRWISWHQGDRWWQTGIAT